MAWEKIKVEIETENLRFAIKFSLKWLKKEGEATSDTLDESEEVELETLDPVDEDDGDDELVRSFVKIKSLFWLYCIR